MFYIIQKYSSLETYSSDIYAFCFHLLFLYFNESKELATMKFSL